MWTEKASKLSTEKSSKWPRSLSASKNDLTCVVYSLKNYINWCTLAVKINLMHMNPWFSATINWINRSKVKSIGVLFHVELLYLVPDVANFLQSWFPNKWAEHFGDWLSCELIVIKKPNKRTSWHSVNLGPYQKISSQSHETFLIFVATDCLRPGWCFEVLNYIKFILEEKQVSDFRDCWCTHESWSELC